jgi:hypothetical protein
LISLSLIGSHNGNATIAVNRQRCNLAAGIALMTFYSLAFASWRRIEAEIMHLATVASKLASTLDFVVAINMLCHLLRQPPFMLQN